MIQHHSPISGVAAFKDQFVATAGYDNQIILWDAQRKKSVTRSQHDHLANQCVFSKCGSFLASASSDHTARIWSVPSLQLVTVLGDHQDDVEMVSFHPHLYLLATASRDHCVRVFNFMGQRLSIMIGHTADVISVDWNTAGDELISSSDDGTVKRWDWKTGRLLEEVPLDDVETDTLVTTQNGLIFAGNDNGEIVKIENKSKKIIKAHASGIKRLVYSENKKILVSISYDRSMIIWDASESELHQSHRADIPSLVWPRSCAFKGDNELVLGTFGSSYAVYNLSQKRWIMDSIQPTLGINAVASFQEKIYTVGDAGLVKQGSTVIAHMGSLCNFLVATNNYLLTGGQMGSLFDAMTGETLYQHYSPLNCATRFTKGNDEYIVIGTYTGEGLVFRINSKGSFHFQQILQLHNNAIKGLASNANHIFSVCASGAAASHSTTDFLLSHKKNSAHDKIANACCVVSSNTFASVSRDLKLRIWKNNVAQEIETPHSHSIKCIASHQNLIATGSYNGCVEIFDLNQQKWIYSERPTTAGISCITFHQGSFIASSYDGQVYRLDQLC